MNDTPIRKKDNERTAEKCQRGFHRKMWEPMIINEIGREVRGDARCLGGMNELFSPREPHKQRGKNGRSPEKL